MRITKVKFAVGKEEEDRARIESLFDFKMIVDSLNQMITLPLSDKSTYSISYLLKILREIK